MACSRVTFTYFYPFTRPLGDLPSSPVRCGPVPGDFPRNIATGHEADSTASLMPRVRMLSAVGPTATPPCVFIAWCLIKQEGTLAFGVSIDGFRFQAPR